MGDFRIVIEGVGSHGCGREAKDGEVVKRCGQKHCVDCMAIEAQQMIPYVKVARLEHWPVPGAAGTVRTENPGPVDDLLSGVRTGEFGRTPYQQPATADDAPLEAESKRIDPNDPGATAEY